MAANRVYYPFIGALNVAKVVYGPVVPGLTVTIPTGSVVVYPDDPIICLESMMFSEGAQKCIPLSKKTMM